MAISDLGQAGLPAESVVRTAKIATIEAKKAERIGSLLIQDRVGVAQHLALELAHATH
ncbi:MULTISPECIES: hypothetical protein [unclassified Azospirillum]|uniref:hypothetical protein n=1 Tax=unclassified Azospirillum TaxID=2630922 RepID=UPI00190E8E46|nr:MULTISPECIES: hypothetical protein [unclassified Azospirillum]